MTHAFVIVVAGEIRREKCAADVGKFERNAASLA
jgi:hypothetical protein